MTKTDLLTLLADVRGVLTAAAPEPRTPLGFVLYRATNALVAEGWLPAEALDAVEPLVDQDLPARPAPVPAEEPIAIGGVRVYVRKRERGAEWEPAQHPEEGRAFRPGDSRRLVEFLWLRSDRDREHMVVSCMGGLGFLVRAYWLPNFDPSVIKRLPAPEPETDEGTG